MQIFFLQFPNVRCTNKYIDIVGRNEIFKRYARVAFYFQSDKTNSKKKWKIIERNTF